MTFSEEILNGIMDVAAAHKNEHGADLVGINMEGPYISPKKVGAQNPKYVQGRRRRHVPPPAGPQRRVDQAGGRRPRGARRSWTSSSDCHDEVRISIAHTCTHYDTAKAAFAAGATHMTHRASHAMPGITHRAPPHYCRAGRRCRCGADHR